MDKNTKPALINKRLLSRSTEQIYNQTIGEDSSSTFDKDRNLKYDSTLVTLNTNTDMNIQAILDDMYDKIVKERFLDVELNKNVEKTLEENQELNNLKQRIDKNLCQLEHVQQRFQKISFRSETELLKSVQNPNYENILKKTQKENYETSLEKLNASIKNFHSKKTLENENKVESGSQQMQNIMEEIIKMIET